MSRFNQYLEAYRKLTPEEKELKLIFALLKNSLEDAQSQGVKIEKQDITKMVDRFRITGDNKNQLVSQLSGIFVG